MSEIEKMYRNAGVEKEFEKPAECTKNPYITCDGCMLYDDKKGKCNNRKDYPLFTAEKQIEITRKLWEFRPNIYPNFDLLVNHSYGEMIATFVNNLWQDLTEEEKQQIKEILE